MDVNKKITELGLVDLAVNEYEKYHSGRGYKMSLFYPEAEMIALTFTLYHLEGNRVMDDVTLLCDDMQVGEFIRFFDLEVGGDLERLSLDLAWSELYMTGKAVLEFDARPPFWVRYGKESELQTLEDLREFCRRMER
jgi:hypothetical protein